MAYHMPEPVLFLPNNPSLQMEPKQRLLSKTGLVGKLVGNVNKELIEGYRQPSEA